MENTTRDRIYAYEVKNKFLGVELSQKADFYYSDSEEVDQKRVLKGTKLSKNEKTGEITIKASGKKFVTLGLYHIGAYGETNYFKDKLSGKFYLLNKGEISGPYNEILGVSTDRGQDGSFKGELFSVTDENDQVLKVDSDLKKEETNNKYVGNDVVQNKDGKFAYSFAGKPTTDFIFDNPTIEKTESFKEEKIYTDKTAGVLYVFNKNNNFIAKLPDLGKINEFEVSDGNLAMVLAEKGFAFVDFESKKVLYQSNTPASSYVRSGNSFVINLANSKSVYAKQDIKWEGYKRNISQAVSELPYEACDVKEDCIQVKNKDGKFGIVDKDGKVVANFDYEDAKVPYYKNKTDEFLPIVKDGKMGLFNAKTKKIEVEPFCKSIDLDDKYSVVSLGDNYYRILFEDENGKTGIINNKGQIIVEPVLKQTSATSGMFGDHYCYSEFRFKEKNGDNSRVCISLNNPEMFPTRPEIHYSTVEKEVEETHTRNKYSEGEVLAGTVIAGQIFGGVGAVGAYGYLSSQKEEYKTKSTVKETTSSTTQYNVPEGVLPYVHIDTAELPEKLRGDAKDLPKPMTIEEYKKKVQSEQQKAEKKVKTQTKQEIEKENIERDFE